MWDLTIPGPHDFYVAADSATVLVHNCGLSPDLAKLATQHVTNSGDTVLGRFVPGGGGYIGKAISKGASYFDIGSKWDDLVAQGVDPWSLNKYFLDTRIAAKDRILLSIPKAQIDSLDKTAYLSREIDYLTSKGYHYVNQWSLRPGE